MVISSPWSSAASDASTISSAVLAFGAHRQRAHRSGGLCFIQLHETPKVETADLGSIRAEALWKISSEGRKGTAHATDRLAYRIT
jgi:hypothetical protein